MSGGFALTLKFEVNDLFLKLAEVNAVAMLCTLYTLEKIRNWVEQKWREILCKTHSFNSNTKYVRLCYENKGHMSHLRWSRYPDLVSITLESDCPMDVGLAAILTLTMWGTYSWQTGLGVQWREALEPDVVIHKNGILHIEHSCGIHSGMCGHPHWT